MAAISLGMLAAQFNGLSNAQKLALLERKRQEAVQQFGGSASDWNISNPLGGEFGSNLTLENTSIPAPSDNFDEEGGAFPGFRDAPTVVPTVGDGGGDGQKAITAEGILAAVRLGEANGGISKREAITELTKLNWSTARISRALEGIPDNPPPVDDRVGDPLATSKPAPTRQPFDVEELLKALPFADVRRRFAQESGVSPGFRPFVENFAQRQELPFVLGAARGQNPLSGDLLDTEADTFRSTLGSQAFTDFLGRGGAPQGLGASLRGAADFLRRGALSDDPNDRQFSLQQEVLRGLLTNPNVPLGAGRFAPTLNLLNRGPNTIAPGIDFGGALNRSLGNLLSSDPLRFQTAPDFIDFLEAQRVIR